MELSRRYPLPWLLIGVAFLLIFGVKRWEDVVKEQADGSYSLSEDRATAIDDRVDKLKHHAEFYALTAKNDAYYLCPLCPPEASKNGKFFLYYKEIYKVGVTINPEARYTRSELTRWGLDYLVLAKGSLEDMLIKETLFMGNYPTFPENLRRPKYRRLATPPGSGAKLK